MTPTSDRAEQRSEQHRVDRAAVAKSVAQFLPHHHQDLGQRALIPPPPVRARSGPRRHLRGPACPVCSRSASGLPEATMRPRAITMMVSQSAETSCMTWLENTTVRPSARSRRMISRTARVLITSRPLVGSSSSTLRGSCTRARAMRHLGPLAVREAGGAAIGNARHVEPLAAARRCAAARTLRRQPLQLAEVLDVLARRSAAGRGPTRPAARQGAPARPCGSRTASTSSTVMRPASGRMQRVEHPERGGLAGAVGPEQAGDRPIGRHEAHIVDRRDRAELLAEVLDANHGRPIRVAQGRLGAGRRQEERRPLESRQAARCRGRRRCPAR